MEQIYQTGSGIFKTTPQDYDLIIDWFQFTIKDMYIEDVIKLIFNVTPDDCEHTMSGLNGYTETFTFGKKMHVMYNPLKNDMGINVKFSGSACREYEELFSFNELFYKLAKYIDQINVNRIDIAIDYFGNDFNVKTIQKKVDKEQFTSRFKTCSVLYEKQVNGDRIGEMVTFGRKVSDLHIVFYNKKLEREALEYKFKKDIKNWTRCELRFRHKNAKHLFKLMSNNMSNLPIYIKGVLRNYLSFKVGVYNGDKKNKYRDDECRWWQIFTSNVQRCRLSSIAESSSIVKKRNYAEYKLSKMIAILYLADDQFLQKCISKGVDKITESDRQLLNYYFISNNMPLITKHELEEIVEKYKNKKNIKVEQEEIYYTQRLW